VILQGVPCPACGRKGLHHPGHPHAYGYRDGTRVQCQFCKKMFGIREKPVVFPLIPNIPTYTKLTDDKDCAIIEGGGNTDGSG